MITTEQPSPDESASFDGQSAVPVGHAVSHQPSATGARRIDALDGLRAFALVIIMSYHFGWRAAQGGFFSLDIFYVLSGYLITGLLLSEFARRERIALGAFWLRRARRLLPALFVVVIVVTLYVRFVALPGTYPEYKMSALSALFYFSNWWQIAASGNYFHATGPVYPLTHTWSLAVEEQFYLLWPLVVVATMKLARTYARGLRALLGVSVLGALASAITMVLRYSATANITRLYFGTDTHAQSILIGAVLACVLTLLARSRNESGMAPVARRFGGVLTALGLVGVATTLTITYVFQGTDAFCYRGGFTLSALAAAAIVAASVMVPTGPLARVLATRPLVFLGTVSYGAYLWHFPIFLWLDATRTHTHGVVLFALRFVATFLLATASYFLLERPVMERRFWRSARAAVPAALALGLTVVVVVALGTSEAAGSTVVVTSNLTQAERANLASVGAFDGHPIRFMIVGDSLALTLAVGLQEHTVAPFGVQVIDRATLGCDIDDLPAYVSGNLDYPGSVCRTWRAYWSAQVATYRPDVVGLLLGRWLITDHVLPSGQVVHIGEPAWNAHLLAELNQVVRVLTAHGAHLVLLTMPVIDPPTAPDGTPYPENSPQRVAEYNALVAKVAAAHPDTVTVFDLGHILTPGGVYRISVGSLVLRWPDGQHITKAAGEWLQPQLLPQVGAYGVTVRQGEAASH